MLVLHVTYNFSSPFRQIDEAIRWRVFYRRGLPRLVFFFIEKTLRHGIGATISYFERFSVSCMRNFYWLSGESKIKELTELASYNQQVYFKRFVNKKYKIKSKRRRFEPLGAVLDVQLKEMISVSEKKNNCVNLIDFQATLKLTKKLLKPLKSFCKYFFRI